MGRVPTFPEPLNPRRTSSLPFVATLLPEQDLAKQFSHVYWRADPGSQFVRAVMISSVDGGTSRAGRSGGLGNSADKILFGVLRAQADVVLVGAKTVHAEGYAGDRPGETASELRKSRGLNPLPVIAVVSRSLRIPTDSAIFTDTGVRSIVVTCESAPKDRRSVLAEVADVIVAGGETVDLATALAELRQRGHVRVSCEGGPALLGALADTGHLDELSLTVAPLLIGGASSRLLTGPELTPALSLTLLSVLHDAEYLFLRYGVAHTPAGTR
jgi:riboflavin-specific deaminase-like protein